MSITDSCNLKDYLFVDPMPVFFESMLF